MPQRVALLNKVIASASSASSASVEASEYRGDEFAGQQCFQTGAPTLDQLIPEISLAVAITSTSRAMIAVSNSLMIAH
jgi:hypothetical protein